MVNSTAVRTFNDNTIPEEMQQPWRKRLRYLRCSLGLKMSQIRCCREGSLTVYELHDISTMSLGAFVSLAHQFGMTPVDLLTYLSSDTAEELGSPDRSSRRLNTYFQSLSPNNKKLALEMIELLTRNQN